jgi:nitrite reductase (NAD(P)H)
MSGNWQLQIPVEEMKAGSIEGGPDGAKGLENENERHGRQRKRIVVVGLGMVGISFM